MRLVSSLSFRLEGPSAWYEACSRSHGKGSASHRSHPKGRQHRVAARCGFSRNCLAVNRLGVDEWPVHVEQNGSIGRGKSIGVTAPVKKRNHSSTHSKRDGREERIQMDHLHSTGYLRRRSRRTRCLFALLVTSSYHAQCLFKLAFN
jgi:hypothetical protein